MRIAETPKITVAIRKRPLNKKELQRSETDIVRVGQNGQVTISEYKSYFFNPDKKSILLSISKRPLSTSTLPMMNIQAMSKSMTSLSDP